MSVRTRLLRKLRALVTAYLPIRLSLSRESIARLFIRGRGLEIGALNTPLRVPRSARVRYVDVVPEKTLLDQFPELSRGTIRVPDLLTDIESLSIVADGSEDFVIANHVLEHTEDPLRALQSVARVLRSGGIFYFALPDKRFTFDRTREITSLDHLITDHTAGPEVSRREHYEEWIRCVDGLTGDEATAKLDIMLRERSNIHFHVWEANDMIEWINYAINRLGVPFDVKLFAKHGSEVIWVLSKRPSTQPPIS